MVRVGVLIFACSLGVNSAAAESDSFGPYLALTGEAGGTVTAPIQGFAAVFGDLAPADRGSEPRPA